MSLDATEVVSNFLVYNVTGMLLITDKLDVISKPSSWLGWLVFYIFGPNIDKYEVATKINGFVNRNKSFLLEHEDKDEVISSLETLHRKTGASALLGAINTLKGVSLNDQYRRKKGSSHHLHRTGRVTVPRSPSPPANEETAFPSYPPTSSDLLAAHSSVNPYAAQTQRGVVEAIYSVDHGAHGASIVATEIDEDKFGRCNTLSDHERSLYGISDTTAVYKDSTFEAPRYINTATSTTYHRNGTTGYKTSRLDDARDHLTSVY